MVLTLHAKRDKIFMLLKLSPTSLGWYFHIQKSQKFLVFTIYYR